MNDVSLLYIECNAGIAGDMLCAALLDLLPEKTATEALRLMNELPLPEVRVEAERAETCGVTGAHVRVIVHGEEEHGHDAHEDEHDHAHAKGTGFPTRHRHAHRSLDDVDALIVGFDGLPTTVRENARAVYRLIAEAEAAVHGTTIEDIHFHEVGTLDAIADVTFACLLMDMIAADRIVASPVRTGFGEVHCAHGTLPVPAPATALLLQGIPAYAGDIEGEFCTPTGAALLKHFAAGFQERPTMSTTAVGYGIGTKRFPIANCVRAFLGEAAEANARPSAADDIVEVCCNIDDMTAEDIAFACDCLMDAGALDAFTVPIGMKKGRAGTMVCALCDPAEANAMEDVLFKHTSTLGVRRCTWQRTTLQREVRTVDTPLGPVRQKIAHATGNACGTVERTKWEHDDLARLAREHGLSIGEVRRRLEN